MWLRKVRKGAANKRIKAMLEARFRLTCILFLPRRLWILEEPSKVAREEELERVLRAVTRSRPFDL